MGPQFSRWMGGGGREAGKGFRGKEAGERKAGNERTCISLTILTLEGNSRICKSALPSSSRMPLVLRLLFIQEHSQVPSDDTSTPTDSSPDMPSVPTGQPSHLSAPSGGDKPHPPLLSGLCPLPFCDGVATSSPRAPCRVPPHELQVLATLDPPHDDVTSVLVSRLASVKFPESWLEVRWPPLLL